MEAQWKFRQTVLHFAFAEVCIWGLCFSGWDKHLHSGQKIDAINYFCQGLLK